MTGIAVFCRYEHVLNLITLTLTYNIYILCEMKTLYKQIHIYIQHSLLCIYVTTYS